MLFCPFLASLLSTVLFYNQLGQGFELSTLRVSQIGFLAVTRKTGIISPE
jgi:hypothetical protein